MTRYREYRRTRAASLRSAKRKPAIDLVRLPKPRPSLDFRISLFQPIYWVFILYCAYILEKSKSFYVIRPSCKVAMVQKNNETEVDNESRNVETLVADWVENGAESVYLLPEVSRWCDGRGIAVRVHIPPQQFNTLEEVPTVEVDGATYPLEVEVSHWGMPTEVEVPLYVSESWQGIEPVSIDEGIRNAVEFLERDTQAEVV